MFRRSPLEQYGQVKHDAQAEFASAHEKTLMLFDGAIDFMGVAQQDDSHRSNTATSQKTQH